jgi:hypothetical protein
MEGRPFGCRLSRCRRHRLSVSVIERKEAYEREQARAREVERENCQKETECDNPPVTTGEVSESAEVVKH